MAVQIKICGINSAAAADASARAGATFGGLVFHPHSPRFLSLDAGRTLAERLRGRVRIVALIADANDEEISTIMAAVAPDFFQLHGGESIERAGAIRARFAVPVIKAVAVADARDLATAAAYEGVADMLLFDAKPPSGALRGGGHGGAFDWQLLKNRIFARPWFLAGGLHPGNVARAVAASGARFVDVSSGVESAPGEKSVALIEQFVATASDAVRA